MAHPPERYIFADAQEVVRAAATLFVTVGQQAIRKRARFLVALSGGSTPKALYTILASNEFAPQLDWSRVHFLFGDERAVPPTHHDSNFALANTLLFTPLNIPAAHIHRMRGEDPPETASSQYEDLLRRLTTTLSEQWPVLDLVLLGMGEDGHTASLFPGTPALSEQTRWVVPGTSPQGTRSRITLTLGVINHASVILFLVTGPNKATVVRRIFDSRADAAEAYPAARIRPETGRLLWYLDRAAASELTEATDELSS
ncbi:MAG: 6-phosphogluconolactonase [Nitrospira sp.]|nr:6-phosphogluconolactonase [Nitrospira sp.]